MRLNLRRNAAWAMAEVIASGLTLFFLYKIIVGILGVAALGIWSLVLAITSLGKLADIGAATGLSRFVAIAGARGDDNKSVEYVETAFVTNLCLYAAIALMLWGPAYYGLALATSGDNLIRARGLLPYSLVSFVCIGLAGAITGAVVGQQRSDQKSMIGIMGLIVQFAVAVAFVRRFGLPALAWAQIAQYLWIIGAGWTLFLRNHHGAWALRLPRRWRHAVFRELLDFGMRMQAATLLSLFYDPVTKFLLSSMGGLEALGFYEMAQRLVQQARQLVVAPAQTLVPGFAHLKEQAPEKVALLYHQAAAATIALGLPLMACVATASPLICYLWIGHSVTLFITFTLMACAGWTVNLIAAPAYLLGVAGGNLRWNIRGHIFTTCGTLLLGFALGRLYGATGVAFAGACMLGLGSMLSMIMNCRALHIPALPTIHDFRAIALKLQINF